jgi:protein ImuB
MACLYFASPVQDILALAEACHRFTPLIARQEKRALFLEIGGSLKLFHGESQLLHRILCLCRRFGQKPNVGIGTHPSHALMAAQWLSVSPRQNSIATYLSQQNQDSLPLQALCSLLSPFCLLPPRHPLPVMIYRLQQLGLETLADFKLLPLKTLASRFGPIGLEARQALSQAPFISWPQIRWPEKLCESIDMEPILSPTDLHLSQLLFPIKTLVDRISARLHGRGLKAQSFNLTFWTESSSANPSRSLNLCFRLPLALSSKTHLVQIVKERLQLELSKQPFSLPIQSLQLEIVESVRLRTDQQDFFIKSEEEEENLSSLLTRLEQRLGPRSIFVASPLAHYRPESAWQKSSPSQFLQRRRCSLDKKIPPQQMIFFERPTRLLPQPKPLNYKNQRLYGQGRYWQVTQWDGPERLQGNWWDQPLIRDYYKCSTTSGEKLWVFSHPHDHRQLYLHGFFD